MIHVCIGFSDIKGTYSKFVGTTICSIFENTSEKITVHLMTDDKLTAENREKFEILADNYRQTIEIHDLSKLIPEKLRWLSEQIPQAKNNRVTLGDLYRCFVPPPPRYTYLRSNNFH